MDSEASDVDVVPCVLPLPVNDLPDDGDVGGHVICLSALVSSNGKSTSFNRLCGPVEFTHSVGHTKGGPPGGLLWFIFIVRN